MSLNPLKQGCNNAPVKETDVHETTERFSLNQPRCSGGTGLIYSHLPVQNNVFIVQNETAEEF